MATQQRTTRRKRTTTEKPSQPSVSEADLQNEKTETTSSEASQAEEPQVEEVKSDKPKVDKNERARQWELLSPKDKERLNVTREEFLALEDVTGFGFNSYFTPLEERRIGVPAAGPDSGDKS